jgi:uncharacterized protein (DUF1697 family)
VPVYIVLFRGVGGATQLPVKQLREVLGAAGFDNVATYINSGNAVVKTSLPKAQAASLIAETCRREMGFEKDILLVAETEWSDAIEANPFPEAVLVPTSLHLFALAGEPSPEAVEALKARKQASERLVVAGAFMYFHAPDGFGPSKTPPLIDRTLGVVTTARNWNSVLKLQQLARAAS